MFDEKLYAEALQCIRNRVYDPELQAVALVLTWFRWRTRPDVGIRRLAKFACLHVLAGRDLPGVDTGKTADAYRLNRWAGGLMKNVREHRPGPERQAIFNEQWKLFWESLSEREKEMADALIEGKRGMQIAEQFGISAGRVTQIRQAMMRHLKE